LLANFTLTTSLSSKRRSIDFSASNLYRAEALIAPEAAALFQWSLNIPARRFITFALSTIGVFGQNFTSAPTQRKPAEIIEVTISAQVIGLEDLRATTANLKKLLKQTNIKNLKKRMRLFSLDDIQLAIIELQSLLKQGDNRAALSAIYSEHPNLKVIKKILAPQKFPKLGLFLDLSNDDFTALARLLIAQDDLSTIRRLYANSRSIGKVSVKDETNTIIAFDDALTTSNEVDEILGIPVSAPTHIVFQRQEQNDRLWGRQLNIFGWIIAMILNTHLLFHSHILPIPRVSPAIISSKA
jgi:hypothetical protein